MASAGGARLRPAGDGLLVGAGYRLPVPPAPAFCVGNVLVTRLGYATFTGEVRLFAHEARHATQYACCGGVLMLPLYGIAAAVSWALCGDFGARNVFEQRAGLADGGYTEKDLRPVLRRRTSRRPGTGDASQPGTGRPGRRDQATSNRSRFITLSTPRRSRWTNFSFASSLA